MRAGPSRRAPALDDRNARDEEHAESVAGSGAASPLAARRRDLPIRTGVAVAVLVLLLVGGGVLVLGPWRGLPDDAAFRVGDEVVSTREFERRVDVVEALYGVAPPPDPAGADRFRRAAARALVVNEVVGRVASERGVVVGDDDIRTAMVELVRTRERAEGPGSFVRLLGTVGASERDVLDEIRRRETYRRLLEQVARTVPPVSGTEVARAYEQRRAELISPERRRVRNIVTAGRADAEALLERARRGSDFAALAREASLDPTTRESGGDLGLVTRARLERAYGDAAFGAAGPGGLFGPVETQDGWNVGQVVQVVPARPLALPEVADRLRVQLQRQRVQATWNAWLTEQVRHSDVEYAEPYRPVGPDPAEPGAAPPVLGTPPAAPGERVPR